MTAELERLRQLHAAATREAADRVGSAVHHCDLAVTAYLRGDAAMAGQYGRAATVFDGHRLPPPASTSPH